MMKPKFTPGPWRVMCINDIKQPEENRRDCHCGYIFDSINCDKTIGKVYHNDQRLPDFEPLMGELLVEEKNANAYLIAAAPEMYEALEEMLVAFSMENIGVDASLRRTSAKREARNAIAKARGE